MSVQIWSPGEALTGQVVMCRVAEAAALRGLIAETNSEIAAYQLAPNGENYRELLRCLLALRQDPKWVPSTPFQGNHDSVWITRNFHRLAFGLTHWDDSAAIGAIEFLLRHDTVLHPQQVAFLRFCQSLVNKVIRRMLWGSPMISSWPPAANRLWWEQNPDLAQEVKNHVSDLSACFHGVVPSVLHGMSLWLNHLHGRLTTSLFVPSREDALLDASALCEAQMRIHLSHSRYSLATLLCHRAADLLFTSLCAGQNLIDHTQSSGEGELKTSVRGTTKLSLLTCYDALVQASVLVANGARKRTLTNLNLSRNRLLLTHSLGSISAVDAKTNLQEVHSILKAHGGPKWERAYKGYCNGISLKALDFFELSDGLMETLAPL